MGDWWKNERDRQRKLAEASASIMKHDIEKSIQPFKMNSLLEQLIEAQTPRWVNYSILIISVLALVVGVVALLHAYHYI
jgi:hypothetical protein